MNSNEKIRLKTQERGLIYIRDALSFYLMDVRIKHNVYNITIIIISMVTTFFETLNTEFNWSNGGKGAFMTRFSTIFPIAIMTSFIAFTSSMMKFERLSGKNGRNDKIY